MFPLFSALILFGYKSQQAATSSKDLSGESRIFNGQIGKRKGRSRENQAQGFFSRAESFLMEKLIVSNNINPAVSNPILPI